MTNSKKMEMGQLENIAGGTYAQSLEVANILTKAGYMGLVDGFKVNFKELRSAIDSLGFECRDHGGIINQNTYVNKLTRKIYTQEDFKIVLDVVFNSRIIA